MCFSFEASLMAGGGLVALGGYCVARAARTRPTLLVLAVVPLIFGLHQLSEACVWWGLLHDDPVLVRRGALVFLFVALALWPFWFPLTAAILEPRPAWKRAFLLWALASTFWFWVLYFPLLVGSEGQLSVRIEQHSIHYDCGALLIYQYLPHGPLRGLYFLCVAAPFALGKEALRVGWALGLLMLTSVVVTVLLYEHAFVSVWCFFAALLSGYLVYLFHGLDRKTAEAARSPTAVSLP